MLYPYTPRALMRPEPKPIPPADDLVEKFFADGGVLSQFFPGYKPRSGQLDMVRAVWWTLMGSRHLLVEAPCGIGKTFAYTVPAIIHRRQQVMAYLSENPDADEDQVLMHVPPVVICTENNSLLDQLITKDLPFLQRALGSVGMHFTFAPLKGRGQYFCNAKASQAEATGTAHRAGDTEYVRNEVDRILAWAKETMEDHTLWDSERAIGEQAHLSFEPSPEVWSRFSASQDECPWTDCGFFTSCFASRAAKRALQSDVIVTNHHLRMLSRWLPHGGPLIVDEGHGLPDVARDCLGHEMRAGWATSAMEALLKENIPGLNRVVYPLADAVGRGFAHLDDWYNRNPKATRLTVSDIPKWTDAELEGMSTIVSTLDSYIEELKAGGSKRDRAKTTKLKIIARKLANLTEAMTLLQRIPDEWAVYCRENTRRVPTWYMRLLEPAPILQKLIWAEAQPTVVCSATLAVNGSLDTMGEELGMRNVDSWTLTVPSPFDFHKQSLLIIPKDMPDDPNTDFWREQMVKLLKEVVMMAEGRTLALFTSYRNLRLAQEALERIPYRLMVQGDKPKAQLLTDFAADTHSVLLGTASFWTGVDVQGEALSALFVDKIPFPMMDDPIVDARSAMCPPSVNKFARFQLFPAVLTIRQGIGRLIRSVDDRGIAVLADRRAVTKRYSRDILGSLGMPLSNDIRDILTVLGTAKRVGTDPTAKPGSGSSKKPKPDLSAFEF